MTAAGLAAAAPSIPGAVDAGPDVCGAMLADLLAGRRGSLERRRLRHVAVIDREAPA